MKTFIVNAARGVAAQKNKYDVTSKLMGREWRMLTDEPAITGKYIFLKDGKLLLSVNGLSTYSTWQMATESSIIMDEGVATFLYKVVHIDDNVVVLNLDGTENFCFLINDSSESLAKASLEDIQWYLYHNCNIDILSPEQKSKREYEAVRYGNDLRIQQEKDDDQDVFYFIVVIVVVVVVLFLLIIYCVNVNN